MEHSTAIMEDAGATIEAAVARSSIPTESAPDEAGDSTQAGNSRSEDDTRGGDTDNCRKRKAKFHDASMHHGSRGLRRSGGRDDSKRHKKGDMGRGDYFRGQPDKRQKNQESTERREAGRGPGYGVQFSKEEIDADEKKPKRKVAVMIGYSGTGYKGMQISASEKTIEGDLFNAFIAAGAISKANANDPKKVSLVRCARTDKGVHAAGNMISLKLIVEDEDIVQKINENLSSQIRVWGIERTIGSFSCYQACDSRWYEYLIPSHAFLPPHPSSWLAKRLEDYAGEDRDAYESRQAEVKGFWERVDEEEIRPILETIDADIRWDVVKALQGEDEASAKAANMEFDDQQPVKVGASLKGNVKDEEGEDKSEEAVIILHNPVEPAEETESSNQSTAAAGNAGISTATSEDGASTEKVPASSGEPPQPTKASGPTGNGSSGSQLSPEAAERLLRLRAATKKLRLAYNLAKRRHRIPAERVERVQNALDKFVGTMNYHNYTVQKSFRDPSAKRHIRSFVVNPKPILIGEGEDSDKSEWLSLKVHGQSFMMHQIRKMIGMVTLLVRCGSDLATLTRSLGEERFSIPKVPGLGLLLERPVFDSYNTLQAVKHGREQLLFSKYETELEAFKEREIYQRIFREEEERNEFAKFFNHLDNFKEPYFLYVTGRGWEATKDSGPGITNSSQHPASSMDELREQEQGGVSSSSG